MSLRVMPLLVALFVLAGPVHAQSDLPPVLPPQSLSATVEGSAVTLTWEHAPNQEPESYNIYRDGVLLASVEGTITTFVDVQPDGSAYFVTATAGTVESAPSNVVQPHGACITFAPLGLSPESCSDLAMAVVLWLVGQVPLREMTTPVSVVQAEVVIP